MGPLVTAVGTAVSGSKLLYSSSRALPLELPCSWTVNQAGEIRLDLAQEGSRLSKAVVCLRTSPSIASRMEGRYRSSINA